MNIIPAILARLIADGPTNALVSGRVYTELAPEVGKAYPQIVLAIESSSVEEQYSGVSGLASQDVMVSCLGLTYAQANDVQSAAFTSLAEQAGTWSGANVQGCFFDGFSESSIAIPEMGPDAQLYSIDMKFHVVFSF